MDSVYNSIVIVVGIWKMSKINVKIQLNRLKLDIATDFKEFFILVEVNGKNIHKSYSQKVKNSIVNFFGECFNAEIQNGQFALKVATLDQNSR